MWSLVRWYGLLIAITAQPDRRRRQPVCSKAGARAAADGHYLINLINLINLSQYLTIAYSTETSAELRLRVGGVRVRSDAS